MKKIEITLEETRRITAEFEVTEEQLEMLCNGDNIFAEEMLSELEYGYVEYDYTVHDMDGNVIVGWM